MISFRPGKLKNSAFFMTDCIFKEALNINIIINYKLISWVWNFWHCLLYCKKKKNFIVQSTFKTVSILQTLEAVKGEISCSHILATFLKYYMPLLEKT